MTMTLNRALAGLGAALILLATALFCADDLTAQGWVNLRPLQSTGGPMFGDINMNGAGVTESNKIRFDADGNSYIYSGADGAVQTFCNDIYRLSVSANVVTVNTQLNVVSNLYTAGAGALVVNEEAHSVNRPGQETHYLPPARCAIKVLCRTSS